MYDKINITFGGDIMSLLFSLILKDAIIMASDSRTTYTYKNKPPKYVDTTYKTVIMDNKIGISHCRNASCNGKTITEHLYDFMEKNKGKALSRIPKLLKEYFNNLCPTLDVVFLICGYDSTNKPRFYRVYTKGDIENGGQLVPGQAFWEGERTVCSKLFSPTYIRKGSYYELHSDYPCLVKNYDVYDAVKYINFAFKATQEYMSFYECNQTVGGPIDILVLKPDFYYWYQKK